MKKLMISLAFGLALQLMTPATARAEQLQLGLLFGSPLATCYTVGLTDGLLMEYGIDWKAQKVAPWQKHLAKLFVAGGLGTLIEAARAQSYHDDMKVENIGFAFAGSLTSVTLYF